MPNPNNRKPEMGCGCHKMMPGKAMFMGIVLFLIGFLWYIGYQWSSILMMIGIVFILKGIILKIMMGMSK